LVALNRADVYTQPAFSGTNVGRRRCGQGLLGRSGWEQLMPWRSWLPLIVSRFGFPEWGHGFGDWAFFSRMSALGWTNNVCFAFHTGTRLTVLTTAMRSTISPRTKRHCKGFWFGRPHWEYWPPLVAAGGIQPPQQPGRRGF